MELAAKNSLFDFGRFTSYFKKYCMENRKSLLIIGGLIFGIPLLQIMLKFMLFGYPVPKIQLNHDLAWDTLLGFWNFIFLFFMVFSGSIFYSVLKNKEGKYWTLMSPASSAEKFLTYFIIYVPMVIIALFCSFYISDWVRVLVAHLILPDASNVEKMPLSYLFSSMNGFEVIFDIESGWLSYLLLALAMQATFILGSSLWPKRGFLMTICAFIIIQLAASMLMSAGVGVFHIFMVNGNLRFQLDSFDTTVPHILFVGMIVWILFCYIISYIRFKEAEIINRW